MKEYIDKLLITQTIVEELRKKNKASYNNAFVSVINAINAEIVECLKSNQFKKDSSKFSD